ncbi:MAG: hypothetical protein JWN00_4232 [Actinomycetia bacterium]|nr:hypothetical protein [Actinomycetes bacterium]
MAGLEGLSCEVAPLANFNGNGPGWAAGTWAQIRVGAGIAYVMEGALDGAAEQIAPMLTLAPELRMATVTGYLETMDVRLRQRRFRNSELAVRLREQIREFNSAALPAELVEEDD